MSSNDTKAVSVREHLDWSEVIRGIAQHTQYAFFGKARPQFVVAELMLPSEESLVQSNWLLDPVTDGESEVQLGPVPRTSWPVPAEGNDVDIDVDGESVVLSLRVKENADALVCHSPEGDLPELSLYCDADGFGGQEALDSFAVLAAGSWPEALSAPYPGAEPYPRPGTGSCWSPTPPKGALAGPANIVPVVNHPFSGRFLRLPYRATLSKAAEGEVRLSVRVGRDWANAIAEALEGRLYLNHTVLWNRILERIEPERHREETVSLRGPFPILLECVEVGSATHFVDELYTSMITDPAYTVRLEQGDDNDEWVLSFPAGVTQASDIRCAYLRWEDWSTLRLEPGVSFLVANRTPRFRVRTRISPATTDAHLRDVGGAVLALANRGHPFGTSTARLARMIWASLPRSMANLTDATPSQDRPFGLGIHSHLGLRTAAASLSGEALLTHRVTFRVRSAGDARRLQPYLGWLKGVVESQIDPPGQQVSFSIDTAEADTGDHDE